MKLILNQETKPKITLTALLGEGNSYTTTDGVINMNSTWEENNANKLKVLKYEHLKQTTKYWGKFWKNTNPYKMAHSESSSQLNKW